MRRLKAAVRQQPMLLLEENAYERRQTVVRLPAKGCALVGACWFWQRIDDDTCRDAACYYHDHHRGHGKTLRVAASSNRVGRYV